MQKRRQPVKQLNIPNTLSLIRVLLVPAFVATLIFMNNIPMWGLIVPLIIYAITAITDFLDGQIARRCNMITDFGKFIDPLADKFMVLSSMIAILVWMLLNNQTTLALIFMWVVIIVFLRELGVTSLRLVVANKTGIVVAASIWGKVKTVSQMVGTIIILLEPLIPGFENNHILSYIAMLIIAITTLFSGIDYLKVYLPHINSNE
jgi:CDP-diacylglycerol--glycerol-3-phosphate 3-phosphatidyltransferase